MSSILRWFMVLSVCLAGQVSGAQKIFFEQLTTAEGLPSDYINCVFRDSRDYLWIATDKGACRYDGQHFLYLNKDNGLPSNFVNCFAEDTAKNIWIATTEGGICKYDGIKITRFAGFSEDIFKSTTKIHFNKDGSFFIVTYNGLYYCASEKNGPEKVKDCRALLVPVDETHFITGNGNIFYALEKNKDELRLQQLERNDFFKIAGREFLLKKPGFIETYEYRGGKFILKRKFSLDKYHLPADESELKDFFVTKESLFIATSKGLIYTDKKNNELFLNADNGMGTDYIRSIYEDDHENIFFSTYGGGVKIWPNLYLREFRTEGKTTSFFISRDHAFMTTTQNLYMFNPPANHLTSFKNLRGGNYTSVYQSPGKKFYLGSMTCFYELPEESFLAGFIPGKKSTYRFYANSGVSGFFTNEKNELYIGTYGDGIVLKDGKKPGADENHDPGMIEFLVPLKNSFAALTYSSGVTIFSNDHHPLKITTEQNMLSNMVYSVFQEKSDELWIGTFKGLNLYRGGKVIKTFTTGDGLVGNRIICVFRDAQNRLWALSNLYLHLVENNRLRAIKSHPLLYDPKNSINRAMYDPKHDLLYIGLNNALIIADLKKINPDSIVQSPGLSSVQVNSSSFNSLQDQPLVLSQKNRRITFQFSSHFVPLSKKSELYYQLRGFDDDWVLLNDSSVIIYQKLQAGDYALVAKTINPDGYSSGEINLLRFKVLPPFWKRTWFISLSFLFLLVTVFVTGNLISRKRFKKRIELLQQEHRLQLERERIAMELHDNVGSQLTYLINKIDDDYLALSDKKEAEKLGVFARSAMQELRETIWALDKKEVLFQDLEYKIIQLISLYKQERNIIRYAPVNNGCNDITLNSLQALNLYRIIQESLNNAVKHSQATEIKINISRGNGTVHMELSDNGQGFDIVSGEKGYGLRNITNRAKEMNAALIIESNPGRGTMISLQFMIV